MKLIHLQRTIAWVSLLIYTLVKFLVKHPGEILAILNFVVKKTIASPKFFSRNILIEKHHQKFQQTLLQTTKLYKKYQKNFDPQNPNDYKSLEKILVSKAQILYFLIRKIQPKIVIETGVAAGESSSFILQALQDNKIGQLYSIDLPFQWYIYGNHQLHLDSLPPGQTPGYLIPKNLRNNWHLILGHTKKELPKLLKKLGQIDVFFHDSEHSDQIMRFEYQQSWPYIKKGGYLLSDDINYTTSFTKFAKSKKARLALFTNIGIIKK